LRKAEQQLKELHSAEGSLLPDNTRSFSSPRTSPNGARANPSDRESTAASLVFKEWASGCNRLVTRSLRTGADEQWQAPFAIALQEAQFIYMLGSFFVGIAFQPFCYMLIGLQCGLWSYLKRIDAARKPALRPRPGLVNLRSVTAEQVSVARGLVSDS
jgi:hypothetical protein